MTFDPASQKYLRPELHKIMLIQFAFFTGYFLFSLPAAKIVDALATRKRWSSLDSPCGRRIRFPPCSNDSVLSVLPSALMIVAGGMTALQVSANAYVVVLGNPEQLRAASIFRSV